MLVCVCLSVCLFVFWFVCLLVGWLVCWLVRSFVLRDHATKLLSGSLRGDGEVCEHEGLTEMRGSRMSPLLVGSVR